LIQNGVGGEVAGLSALPDARWYGAVTTIVAEWLGPASVRQSRRRAALAVAPLANVKGIGLIARAFGGAGFDEVRVYASYDVMKWSKLLLNILGNAAPAIVDMRPDQALRDPKLFAIERAAYREALAVMRAAHIRPTALPGYPVPLLASVMRWLPAALARPLLLRAVAGGRGGKMPSLHMDLTRRRTRSEVEFLNGAFVRLGATVGTPTPINRALTETLSAIARGDEPWEQFRGRPERLYRRCGLMHGEDTR
jgi:2-dehydropantoate 2-reductase